MVIFEDVFIPRELVFMDGETEFAAMLVERFTCYHRRSYVCKSGVGDVLIGAAAAIAEYNGVDKASHVKDKLVEMTHLNETIYATGIASSYQAQPMKSGCYLNDDMIANVCKHHVTKMPYEIGRLAQDLAGGLMVTMPSEKDLENEETGALLRKYLKGRAGHPGGDADADPAPDREHDARAATPSATSPSPCTAPARRRPSASRSPARWSSTTRSGSPAGWPASRRRKPRRRKAGTSSASSSRRVRGGLEDWQFLSRSPALPHP